VVRAQAAWCLGWFGDGRTMAGARALMAEPVALVRVAAAASVLRRSGPRGSGQTADARTN